MTTLDEPPAWMVAELRRRTGLSQVECERTLKSATLAEYKRICGDEGRHHRVDPAEDDPELATVLLRATLEAERELASEGSDGSCYTFWFAKRNVLRDRYGVEWRTPLELNPGTFFD